MKLAVYLAGLAPYDEALFRGVSKSGVDVHVFVGGKFDNRPYWPNGKSSSVSSFRITYFDSPKLCLGKYVEYFSPKVLSIFRKERYHFVLVPFGSFTGLLLLLVARLSGSLTFSWCGVHKFHQTPVRILGEPIVRLSILLSTYFVAYSSYSKEYLIKEGANSKRIFVLNPNGVDVQKFSPETNTGDLKKRLKIDADRKLVLFTGRLEKEKGVDYLIKSMKIVQEREINAHLLVVGVGYQRPYLERLVRELKMENNVTFVGSISNKLINKYYAICDVHVGPSIITKYFVEPFGMVYQEAMASGKPSIAFDIPAPLREIIVDGETGFLVPEKDEEALASKICELLSDDDKRMIMGKKAREIALENYDINRVAEEWARVFKRLIGPSKK